MYTEGRVTNEGLAGAHKSRLANALDPRVDSTGTGTAHTGSTNAGPHSVSTSAPLNTGNAPEYKIMASNFSSVKFSKQVGSHRR